MNTYPCAMCHEFIFLNLIWLHVSPVLLCESQAAALLIKRYKIELAAPGAAPKTKVILIMIGYGDRARTQLEVCRLFNTKYPNREPITQSTGSKIEQKFLEMGHARDRPRTGRPPVQEDVKLNVLLELQENPHLPTRQVAANLWRRNCTNGIRIKWFWSKN
ncbi:hypothetical protein NQ318_006671 [Aromia moschata]|uniref:DUF4817 domain-containing protein n=1 Tax=Aromia moschata TaxID=1265417 RepID=A0AAV8YQI4_9CUCU|nr:hypothetical protein NQ318_006671 [Aromia moschata]